MVQWYPELCLVSLRLCLPLHEHSEPHHSPAATQQRWAHLSFACICASWLYVTLWSISLVLFCVTHDVSLLLHCSVTFHCACPCLSLTTEQQKHRSHFQGMHWGLADFYFSFIFHFSSRSFITAQYLFLLNWSICHPPTALTQPAKCHTPDEVIDSCFMRQCVGKYLKSLFADKNVPGYTETSRLRVMLCIFVFFLF